MKPIQVKMHSSSTVIISLENQTKEMGLILGTLPLTPAAVFNLVFKLWELSIKAPVEYEDELFSAVIGELQYSDLLKRQLQDANRLNGDNELTPEEVVDRITNIAVGKVNAVIMLLDQPLRKTLKPVMDAYNATIHNVRMGTSAVGPFFVVDLTLTDKPS